MQPYSHLFIGSLLALIAYSLYNILLILRRLNFSLISSSFYLWTHHLFSHYLLVLDKNVDIFLFPVECAANDFTCDNGFCIPASKLCDRTNDCQDASDERQCSYGLAYFHKALHTLNKIIRSAN